MSSEIIPMGTFKVHVDSTGKPIKLVKPCGKECLIESVEVFTKRPYRSQGDMHYAYILQCKTVEGYFFDGEYSLMKSLGFLDDASPVTLH